MKVFDALSKDSSIFGNRFLEASAGTGKTFAIEHVFLRMLLENKNEEQISVENILVVTFTKAATRELKLRIRSNIERALFFLKTEDKSLSSSFNYLTSYLNNKEEALHRLQSALHLFDQAQIFTIHGFCFSMLSKFPFEADAIFNLSEESAYKEIMKRECLDFLRYFAGMGKYFPEQISIILKSNQDISSFIEKIISYNSKRNKELSSETIFQKFNEILEKELSTYEEFKSDKNSSFIFRKKILEDFDKLKKSYKKLPHISEDEILEQVDLLISLFIEGKSSFSFFNEILKTKFSLFDFMNISNRKVKFGKEDSLELNYPHFFRRGMDLFYPLIKDAINEIKIFNNIALDIHENANKKLIEEDLFTFDDLLLKMDAALDIDIFREKVQKLYKAAIVDEFQDTDAVQWEIFKKIFFYNKKDLKAFYLVGDPKQSIYSFRNADLNTYFSAGQFLGDESKYFLRTNYRSTPELISSLNYLFSEKFLLNWINIPKMKLSLSYIPVYPGIEADKNFKDESPVDFFIAKDSSSRIKKWPSPNIENDFLYPFISKEVLRLNREKHIKFENIAVLVKDRYQAERVKRFFLKNEIPAYSTSQQPLFETQAFDALQEVIAATIHCHDFNLIKIALGGPYIRWTDTDIKQKNIDEGIILFASLNETLKTKGLSHFLRSFIYSSWDEEGSIYEKLINKKDLSLYQNTMQLIELLIEEERDKKLTNDGILNFFNDLRTLYGEENSRIMVHPSQELSAIQIMTIHMSKGLEFDVVFALGSCNRMAQQENIDENNLEKFRQLYVALTRAKKKIYVPFIIDGNEKGYEESSFSQMELFFKYSLKDGSNLTNELILAKLKNLQEEKIVNPIFLEESFEGTAKCFDQEKLDFDLLPTSNLTKEQGFIHSFSSLSSKKKYIISSTEEIGNEIIFSSTEILPGAEVGITIHKIFEKIFSGREEKFWMKKYLMTIIDEELLNTPFSKKNEIFYQVVNLALQLELTNSGFAIKDVPLENIFVETEFLFSFKEDKNFMKGFVDLVLLYKGKYYLIDWKSNWLGDRYSSYDTENLELSMIEHEYFLQAAIYAESLKRYLKIIDKRPFSEIFGGAIYLFLRGLGTDPSKKTGVYHFIPDLNLLNMNK